MEIQVELTGRTPLIMHNPRLADPMDTFVKEIAKFSKKRSKTDDDHAEIARLEWFGGLYTDNGKPVLPTANLRKCIIQAGKSSKQGKTIERSVYFKEQITPLVYEGPSDLKSLHADGRFIDRASVVVSNRRIIRVRPKFHPWQIRTGVVLNDSLIDLEDFERILTLAGQIEGLCDGRSLGYGRFDIEIL